MPPELQRLVDSLGSRLGRSVAIDDPHIRLLVHTAHTGQVDAARMGSIMRRSVPAEVTDYVKAHGAAQATDVFIVPACPAIGLELERIGMPIRYEESLLGYLWLLGSDGPVPVEHADAVREAAGQAALILHRDYLLGEVSRSRERELVRDLVSADDGLRAEAVDALVEEDLVVAGPVSALVATLSHDSSEPLGEQGRLALHAAVDRGRRRLPPMRALTLNRPDHSLLLAIWPGARAATVDTAFGELAACVHEGLASELGAVAAPSCWVGVGGTRPRLTEARCSYLEARQAADVARITGVLGPVVSYSRLGVYALLAKLPPDQLAEGIHPGIRLLLGADSGHQDLAETLQAYLDNAGEVQRTAAHLHIHRATLYYRLRRIEELTALDLSRGDDRLAAHLSLKLARLARPG